MVDLLPRGRFVPVTPGTRYVTVGGAIACDVHGKSHHLAGSFGDHVVSLDLVLADGSSRTVGPDRDADLFWATVGGMGLTGVVTSAVLRTIPVETGYATGHHPAASRPRRRDARDGGVRRRPHLLRRVDRHPRPRSRDGALGALPRRARHAATSSPAAPPPTRSPVPDAPATRRPPPLAGQPGHLAAACARSTRRGSARRRGTAAGEIQSLGDVLPPARRRRALEPRLRPARLRAVPVRRPRRAGAGPGPDPRADLRGAAALLPRRAQAVRSRQRRADVLPARRLDPRLRRAGPPRPGAAPRRARPARGRPPAAGSTSPRTPGCDPTSSPRCTPGWPSSAPCATQWTRTASSSPTSPAASPSDRTP